MSAKRFILLLIVIVVVGFGIGFFTQGDKAAQIVARHEARVAAESAGSGELYALTMLTGSSRGMLFNISKALVDALADMGYETAVQVTGGTPQNIDWLLQNKGQFAIANSEKVLQAFHGQGPFAGQPPALDLRVMMSLWGNYWQILAPADSGLDRVADLQGKKIALDERYSDADGALRALFRAAGLTFVEDDVIYASLHDSLDMLTDGRCAAVFMIAMLDGYRMNRIVAHEQPLKLVPVDAETFQKLTAEHPYYLYDNFPARRVYGMAADVPTVSTVDLLLAAKDVPDDTVAGILRDLWANGDEIQKKYPVLRTTVFDENPAYDVGLPFHSGTLEYFRSLEPSPTMSIDNP